MAGGKGGARPGAGRKPKAEKYAGPIAKAERQIVDKLPAIIEAQLRLAQGGIEVVREEFAPAGTITIGSGELLTHVFPDLPPDELVLVKRVVEHTLPDRAANQYLTDRILGKTTTKIEATGENGGPLVIRVEYDDDDNQAPPQPPRPAEG